MATYAIVNEDNEVINVLKLADEQCEDENGNEVAEKVTAAKNDILGAESPMRLIKTSIHSNGRGTCARVGDVWNEEHQMFIEPQPEERPNYVLDTTEGTWGPDTSNRPALTDYQQSVGMTYYHNLGTNEWELGLGNGDISSPDLTEEEVAANKVYKWELSNYVEGDVNAGWVLVDGPPPVEETSSEEEETPEE